MKDDPAFPQQRDIDATWPHHFGLGGLTKRELLAAMNTAAILSSIAKLEAVNNGGWVMELTTHTRDIEKVALYHADMLIAELEKGQ